MDEWGESVGMAPRHLCIAPWVTSKKENPSFIISEPVSALQGARGHKGICGGVDPTRLGWQGGGPICEVADDPSSCTWPRRERVWGWLLTGCVMFKVNFLTWDMMWGSRIWVGDMSAIGSGCGAHTWLGHLTTSYAPLPRTFRNAKLWPTSLVGGERQAPGNVVARG